MRLFRNSLWFILVVAAALSQTVSEKPGFDVRRVGARLQCQCNGCKDSVATCSMLECGFSKPAKEKIARMQSVGMTDDQIIQDFVRDYPAIYLAPPNALGWIVPYAAVGFGLVVIWLFLKKYRKPAALPELGSLEIDDPDLLKYKDQIEKDLAKLE